MSKKIIVMKGDKYWYLTIIEELDKKANKRYFLCKCNCGNECIVSLGNLRNGNTKSCGCKKTEKGRDFTQEHKNKISQKNIGKKMSKLSRYKNMINNLKYQVDLDWLLKFKDIDKLRLLNKLVAHPSQRLTDINYIKFIEFYYYDNRFNTLYNNWLNNNKNKYLKPSFDHIIPISKGGNNNLENIQILTWFENRAKNDISQEDWNAIKNNIAMYLI